MRKVIVFNQVTIDGFIADRNGDMSWAHRSDPEWNAFVEGNAQMDAVMLFGRVTYDMMASFWPSPLALQTAPSIAARMNGSAKVVFSRTLANASWNNTTLVKTDLAGAVRKMKQETGPDMVIFGSASIVAQLAAEGLVDEYQLVVNPLALGQGKSMFAGVPNKVALKLTKTRVFGNGNVFLCYEASR